MAASLKISLQFGFTNGLDSQPSQNISISDAPAASARIDDIVGATTADATLGTTLVSTIGWVVLVNLDNTNSVLVGANGTDYPILISPGQAFAAKWNAAAIHYKASAGTPNVRALVWSA